MNKNIFLVLIISVLLLTFLSVIIEARQGCCSWHGGVCGCACCDGTPLSATCAPYYPSCNRYTNLVVTDKPITPEPPEARSGCCLWHGGVCDCSCCDGTPLSATCVPYYPQCNNGYNIVETEKTMTPEIPKIETIEDECEKGFIGPTFCKKGFVYQEYMLSDCSTIDGLVEICKSNRVCKAGVCENLEYCGDNICQFNENCSVCSIDCGLCEIEEFITIQNENNSENSITGEIITKKQDNFIVSIINSIFSALFSWIV